MPSDWTEPVAEAAVENDSASAKAPGTSSTLTLPVRSSYLPPHLRNKLQGGASGAKIRSVPGIPNNGACSRSRSSAGGWSKPPHGSNGRSSAANGKSSCDLGADEGRFSKEEARDASSDKENTGINFDAYEDVDVEISGEDVPPAVNTFDEIDLGDVLKQNIRSCKYVKPTPVQRHAIPICLAGRDLMACAEIGSGKTAAFCLPIIAGILRSSTPGRPCSGHISYPLALILSPTRQLSSQIHEEATKFSLQTGLRVAAAYGGAPLKDQLRDLEQGVDILVATPGRLVDFLERGRVSLSAIKYLVLDEADQILDVRFVPQIQKIVEQMDMPPPSQRQTMLFSATFPREIQRLSSNFLSKYIFLAVGRVGSSADLIIQKVEYVPNADKQRTLTDLFHVLKSQNNSNQLHLTLVFVETKRGVDALHGLLCRMGFPTTSIHGDKSQLEREDALRSFRNGLTPVLVATDAASRGLDLPHVDHVVNFDLPTDIDDYVHRIGRTGRAGKSGSATAFFTSKDVPLARSLEELMYEANQEVPGWLADFALRDDFGGRRKRRLCGFSRFGGRDFRTESYGGGCANASAGV